MVSACCFTTLLCTQFHPGVGVGLGNDYTLYALKEGIVTFKSTKYLSSVSDAHYNIYSSSCSFWKITIVTDCFMQVHVVDHEAYQIPEGNQIKEGSRKSRRREMYSPRSQKAQPAAV